MILYGDLPNVMVAIGAEITFPSLENSPAETKNEFFYKWESFIGSIPEKYFFQIKSSINADYVHQLSYYGKADGKTRLDKHVRQVNHDRYFRAMDRDELWNRRIIVYCSEALTVAGSERNMTSRLTGAVDSMRGFLGNLESLVRSFGGGLQFLDTRGLRDAVRMTLGGVPRGGLPDLEIEEGEDYIDAAYPSSTVHVDDGVLYHDGRYHRFLVLKDTPTHSFPFMCSQMLATSHKDVAVTVNIRSQSKDEMLDKLETRYNRMRADQAKKPSVRGADDLKQLEASISQLKGSSGGISSIVLVVHLWAPDRDTLLSRTDEVRMNFAMMRGATVYEPSLPIEARRFFYASLPGYHGEKMTPYALEIDPALASRVLPFAAMFKGDQEEPMALYQGEGKSLVGMSLFRGGRPLHTCIFGSSGVGKSAFCNDLLTQMYPFLDRVLIIETGNSYGVTVGLLGGKSLLLSVNGSYRLNLFDTNGSPLMASDISNMASIIFAMTGFSGDKAVRMKAVIATTVESFMSNSLQAFIDTNPEAADRAFMEALLFHRYKEGQEGDYDEKAAFWAFKRDLTDAEVDAVSRKDMLDFIQDPKFEREANRYLYSLMRPEDFELLGDYKDFIKYFREDDLNASMLDDLATLLEPWCGGEHGNLLNGHTNFSITGSLVQLELEGLGENEELKNVVLSLLRVLAFQDVLAAPRSEKKLWLFEEMGSLTRSMEGLGEIAKTIAQTGRKYNLCMLTVMQQFDAMAAKGGMMEATIGNSSQFVIFRQQTKADLEKLLAEVNLPQSLTDMIMDYPYPGDIRPPAPKHSTALLATVTGTGWSLGTVLIHCPPAVLWAADSSGENYEEKLRILASPESGEFLDRLFGDKHIEPEEIKARKVGDLPPIPRRSEMEESARASAATALLHEASDESSSQVEEASAPEPVALEPERQKVDPAPLEEDEEVATLDSVRAREAEAREVDPPPLKSKLPVRISELTRATATPNAAEALPAAAQSSAADSADRKSAVVGNTPSAIPPPLATAPAGPATPPPTVSQDGAAESDDILPPPLPRPPDAGSAGGGVFVPPPPRPRD